MNILGSLRSFFQPGDDDAVPVRVDLTRVQQSNVPSRPRLRGSMLSAGSELTTSSKHVLSSRNATSKNHTRRFLNEHDHVQQDPIEVSDSEEDPENRSTRSSRPQLKKPSASQPAHDDSRRISLNKRQARGTEEGRLLGDFGRKPADAVLIEIPTGPTRESTMPKPKFLTGAGFRPMNTLDHKGVPAHGSKEQFYAQNISIGRTPTKASTVPIPQDPKRKELSRTRLSEPPKKKPRPNDDSPDILHEQEQMQGSKLTKIALESVNHSVHDLTSSPTSPSEGRRNKYSIDLPAGQDEEMTTTQPRKVRVLWPLYKSTAKSIKKITSRPEMVMSDEVEEDQFTKGATRQRRHQDDYDEDVMEIRPSGQVVGNGRKTASTSTLSSQKQISSPSRRIQELNDIIPDTILQRQPADLSSPDVIQEDVLVAGTDSRISRRPKTTPTNSRSHDLPQSRPRKTSGDYEKPSDMKLFRTKRIYFGGALDVSGYVLAVDKATRTFSIDYDSSMLDEDPIVSSIPVDRILKVTHGEKGSKVKIQTSEIPVIGHEMLIELNSHKLAFDLATLLLAVGKGVNVIVKEDSWMDRAFDKFGTIAKVRRGVLETPEQASAFSPYFNATDTRKATGLRDRLNVDHAMVEKLLGVSDGFNRDKEPRERRSAAGRHRQMLQEDLDERGAREYSDQVSRDPEGPASRSRTTRITSTFRSSPPPPPIKYSSTGKLGEPWENPLAYPRNGKKRATVNFDDLSRLDDDEFLNDNLVAFFLRYLEYYLEQEQPDISKRAYFFNSYFYEKLRQKPKEKKSIINYEGVKKWTDKIGLFNRDFVIVPVNENLHWYVAIICNLSWFKLSEAERDALDDAELLESSLIAEKDLADENANDTQQSLQELSLEDRERQGDVLVSDLAPESSGKSSGSTKKKGRKRKSEPHLKSVSTHRPAIITLDSLNLPRYTTVSALKHYIAQEASVRLNKEIDSSAIQGVSAKKIPIQKNYSDCGLFVCAYLERFAVDPTAFMKQELGRIPQQWPELHSHDLRGRMRDFLLDLHKAEEGKTSDKVIPNVGEILLPPDKPPRLTENGTAVDVEIEDERVYDPPTSPAISHCRLLREEEQHEVRNQTSDSEDKPMDINRDRSTRDALDAPDPTSLRARTAKILNSPTTRYSDTLPESDCEPQVVSPPVVQDHPLAMAKRLREARSPKAKRNVRSQSVSTDYLHGTESYEHPDQQMPGEPLDDTEMMLV